MPDRRHRRSRDEMAALRAKLIALVEQHRPLTVRHLFYLAVAAGLIEKTEDEYQNVVIRLTSQLRERWLKHGHGIPFGSDYIVDAGRWIHKPPSYIGIEAALRNTADFYRRDLWAHADDFVASSVRKTRSLIWHIKKPRNGMCRWR